ncbi:MAG: hemolysin family protein [bacterium]
MPLSIVIPAAILLLLAEAVFSGSEIALVSANRGRLRRLAREGDRGAELALRLLEEPEWLMGTILTCHNACFVTNVTLATLTAIQIVGPRYGELASILGVIPFLVIFGEVVPKSYCQERADALAPRLARLIWGARRLVYPIVWVLSRLIQAALQLGEADNLHSPFVTRKELEALLEEPSEGDVKAGERRMIGRIFSFGELDVDNVMVPLVDVSAVEEGETVEDVIERIEEDGHSRILVYREEIHDIVGIVFTRDILALGPAASGPLKGIPNLVRKPYYVPESKPADDLLAELQGNREKLAVVVDEYGGCAGVVTIEDLVEEIVGEISDEYDVDEVRLYQKTGENAYRIDARMEVEIIREELSIPIPEGDYETLGGYVLEILERIPKPGDRVKAGGWTCTVEKATERQIEFIRCERDPNPPADAEAGGRE